MTKPAEEASRKASNLPRLFSNRQDPYKKLSEDAAEHNRKVDAANKEKREKKRKGT